MLNSRRINGITLVELIIIVAIIAIISAIAIPSFRESIDKTRINNQASGVQSIINQAKSEALKRSSLTGDVYLVISPGNSWHVGLSTLGTGCTTISTCLIDSGNDQVSRYWTNDDCSDCEMISPEAVTVIKYNFRGLVEDAADSTTIELESPLGKRVRIIINKVGSVEI